MQQPFRFFSRAAMLLIMMMLTATTAWAETINGVSYIDENGETQTADNVTVLTGNEEPSDNGTIDLTPGWYVVNSTVNYTRSVTMETKGEYHIILADGGKMNIGSSANPIYNDGDNNNPRGIDGSHPLYIYGQTNGTGELNVYTGDFNGDAICVGDLTINGGKITAIASGADGSGLRASKNVTINGGVITARATCDLSGTESFGIKTVNRVIINGGQVTAWGSNKGIYSSAGSISLSWKKITDFIDANSYDSSSLTIATGKVFTDGNGHYYTETNASEVLALTNTKLTPAQGYSVVFDSNGGSDVPTQIVLGGSTVIVPTAPTKAGKVFCGWYLDSRFQTAYDFTSVVTGNLTLYAKWADAISYNLRDALIQRIYRYTGRVITPVVRNNAAQLLTAGTDYTMTGATQMVQPGVYTLTVTGKGSFTGSQTVSVRVLTFDKSDGTNLVTNCTLPANNSNAVIVSSADTTMQSGCWYVVSEDATVAKRISVNGDVNLVLCDGATLTAELGISVTDGNSLTIYSQSGNTGTLVAKLPDIVYHAAIGGDRDKLKSSPVKAGTITIHGGVINAAAKLGAVDIGAAYNGEAGTINIYGGKITTSGSYETGIGGTGATVHLGWCRESSDFIESQAYIGTVVFDKNFVIDGTNIGATQDNIAGKKIVPTAKTLCTVTFQTNGGSIVDALYILSGTTVPEPIPFKAGYQFAGWYTNDGCTDPYDFNTAVDHSFTLYAKWDDVAPISYIDADGYTVTGFTAYTPMENSYIELPEGTYFVGKNTTVSSRIELSGTVNLILGDGATLTAEKGIHVAQHNTLNIFAQSAGTGALTASTDYHNAAIGATFEDDEMGMNHSGTIRIYGGVITANGQKGAAAIGGAGGVGCGTIYIYGGMVTATADSLGVAIGSPSSEGGTISILGGKITATHKGIYGYGIGRENDTTHLGLSKASDFIHASGYMGAVNIKSGLLLTDGTNIYSGNNVSIPNNVTLTQANFTDDGNNSYTIHNAAGWDVVCDALQDNATYNRFIGKTVYLANDITVTRMAGSDKHDFCGTFDGQSNTIDLDLDSNKGGYALFRNAVGATIKNLHVDGTIVTAGKYAAGLISGKWGDITIENCRSSVTIKSSVGGDGTHGGFVAVSNNGKLNIKGCVFDGKIVSTGTSATTYCGGFVGWRGSGDLNISNSFYAPAEIKSGETEISGECTFARNGVTNITNTYYTRTLGDAQGKAAQSITAGENVTVANAGNATEYTVSDITAYGTGIKYGGVLYAGADEEVSLTLSHTDRVDYAFSGYTASTGTLSGSDNPYTLTMPNADVSITCNYLSTLTSGTCGKTNSDNVTWELTGDADHYTLTISGTGDMADYTLVKQQPWRYYASSITSVVVENGVTSIGENAFNGCKLTSITLPEGLTTINAAAFADNGTTVASVSIPQSVTSIGDHAFYGTSVTHFYINNIPSKIALSANTPFVASGTTLHVFTLMLDVFANATNWSNYAGHFLDDIDITHVTSVTLDNERMIVKTLASGKLNATINPADACVKDVMFTSSNDMIFHITDAATGAFQAGSIEGEATITCTAMDGSGEYATCVVRVDKNLIPAESVTLNKSEKSMIVGETIKLTATVNPGNAMYKNVTWRSSDENVATVNNGTVTAIAAGVATITAISGDGNARANCVVTVKAPVTTSYVDTDGTLHENVTAMPLDNSMTILAAGWYVVNEDVNYTSMITLDGDVNLILGDGKTMTVTNTGTDVKDRAIYGDEKTLHIYGQSQCTGALTATAVGGESAIFLETSHDNAGSLLGIHGGVVSASTEWTGGVGISVQCATDAGGIVIDGGQVTASGNDFGIYCEGGHFDILGGQVTATGTNIGGLGICACYLNPGVLTLGYSKTTDFVSTNSIYNYSGEGEVKIATDQTLVDGNGNIWSGTLSNDEIQSIRNQTLRPVTGVALTKGDKGNISATFDATSLETVNIPVGVTVNSVTLNRSFSAGKASTVMLPFDYTCNAKEDGGDFYDFAGVEKDKGTNQWVATMTKVNQLKANTPYMFVAANDIDGITFTLPEKVTLNTTGGGECQKADKGSHWTFKGTYSYMKWTSDTKDAEYTQERADEIGKVYGFAGVAKDDIKLGDFVKAASGARIRPLTCYLIWNNTPNSTRGMTRAAGDEELPSSIVVRLLSNIGPGDQGDDNGNQGNGDDNQGNGDDNQGNGDDQGNDDNGGTTTIGTLDTETGEIDFGGWYTLSGRKLDTKPTQKGLYIHNGKKVVIK